MPFCSQCGAAMEGAVCGKCAAGRQSTDSTGGQLEENVAGALCYTLGGVTGAVFLLLEPYNRNRNIRFHAFQSIFLTVATLLVYYAVGILLPFGLSILVAPFLLLAAMAVWLYIMWRTYQKDRLVLPIIGPMAEKQL